jgi:hypothetical protein
MKLDLIENADTNQTKLDLIENDDTNQTKLDLIENDDTNKKCRIQNKNQITILIKNEE